MKIETIVGDVVLLVLQDAETLKELGIQKNKIYARIAGYDENGIWIEHPNFQIPRMENPDDKNSKITTETVTASVLIAWPTYALLYISPALKDSISLILLISILASISKIENSCC